MGAYPDLRTQLTRQPRQVPGTDRRRRRLASRIQRLAIRCWWVCFAAVTVGIVLGALWSQRVAPFGESVAQILWNAWGVAALCLMILSVVVTVMQGGARGQAAMRATHDHSGEPRARRVDPVAVRCWWASLALTVFAVAAPIAWNEPGPPYDDSIGEIVWFLWMVGLWCLVLFTSAVIASFVNEASARPALRAKVAEVYELRASRGRLIDASDAARRGFERDLHDGVQPRLVALLLNVGMARRAGALHGTTVVIDDIEHELREILSEIRALASGILPPALTDLGLEAAVTELTARMPFAVDLAMPDERMPARAEVTAYFVIAEALTNAAKHAHASRVTVRVAIRDDRATVEVRDDGCGGVHAAGGTGLQGLADRVDSLDGRLQLASTPGLGTTVNAEFSCAS
jgi:signal transduction histidine kinase